MHGQQNIKIPFSVAACIVSVFQAGSHSLGCHDFIHAAACMLGVDSQTEKKSLVSYVLVDMERFRFEGGTGEWR